MLLTVLAVPYRVLPSRIESWPGVHLALGWTLDACCVQGRQPPYDILAALQDYHQRNETTVLRDQSKVWKVLSTVQHRACLQELLARC